MARKKSDKPTDGKVYGYMVSGQYKLTGKNHKIFLDPYFFKGGEEETVETAKKYLADQFYSGTVWVILGGPKGKKVSVFRTSDPAKQTKRVERILVAAKKRLTKLGILGELSFSNGKSIKVQMDNY
jgi:hypothetical protein